MARSRRSGLFLLVDHNDLVAVSCERWTVYFGAGRRRSALARLAVSTMASILVRPKASAQERTALLKRELARLAAVARTPSGSPVPVLLVESGDWATGMSGSELDPVFATHGARRASIRQTMAQLFEAPKKYIIRGEGHPNAAGMARLSAALAEAVPIDALVTAPYRDAKAE